MGRSALWLVLAVCFVLSSAGPIPRNFGKLSDDKEMILENPGKDFSSGDAWEDLEEPLIMDETEVFDPDNYGEFSSGFGSTAGGSVNFEGSPNFYDDEDDYSLDILRKVPLQDNLVTKTFGPYPESHISSAVDSEDDSDTDDDDLEIGRSQIVDADEGINRARRSMRHPSRISPSYKRSHVEQIRLPSSKNEKKSTNKQDRTSHVRSSKNPITIQQQSRAKESALVRNQVKFGKTKDEQNPESFENDYVKKAPSQVPQVLESQNLPKDRKVQPTHLLSTRERDKTDRVRPTIRTPMKSHPKVADDFYIFPEVTVLEDVIPDTADKPNKPLERLLPSTSVRGKEKTIEEMSKSDSGEQTDHSDVISEGVSLPNLPSENKKITSSAVNTDLIDSDANVKERLVGKSPKDDDQEIMAGDTEPVDDLSQLSPENRDDIEQDRDDVLSDYNTAINFGSDNVDDDFNDKSEWDIVKSSGENFKSDKSEEDSVPDDVDGDFFGSTDIDDGVESNNADDFMPDDIDDELNYDPINSDVDSNVDDDFDPENKDDFYREDLEELDIN
ncbi:protein starmaker [Nematostella vectensis]|uniref:protein starmaker n=1 Tax=Nematostella vectensis TaxID=45351 RepID=UPI002076D6AC|nr:protein starmaker [Nematostella vectensis]